MESRAWLGMYERWIGHAMRHLWSSPVIVALTAAIVTVASYWRLFCYEWQATALIPLPPAVYQPATALETLREFLDAERLPDELMNWEDTNFCPSIPDPVPLKQVPEQLPFLMIIGSQKAGTTWLFDALIKHPSFEPSVRRPGERTVLVNETGYTGLREELLSKELKFFNRWPLPPIEEYLHAWNSSLIEDIIAGVTTDRVLLDASPQYLMVPAAAPRVKAAVPHAKFLIVVRDPPMRTYSDYKMMHQLYPTCAVGNSRLCPNGSFAETIQDELNDAERPSECFFNTTASDSTTWFDCFRCGFNFIEETKDYAKVACNHVNQERVDDEQMDTLLDFNCSVPHFGFIDQSKYAAQFAWWLRYFAPEQFIVISSWQLRDPEERVKVLNQILEHVGLGHTNPFSAEMLDKARGFDGSYTDKMTDEDKDTLRLLRKHFMKDQEDLQQLVKMLYPDRHFNVQLES